MLTIFTPTFNRATKLQRVYESLLAQCNKDFEWLIVDDGSIDQTEEIVHTFDTNQFYIKYVKKENGGKHTAYNRALELAQGEYFLCVDSDDWLCLDAVEKISMYVKSNSGVFTFAYKTDEKGKMLSPEFPDGIKQLSFFELNNKYLCSGEYTIILKTSFAQNYPFPVFEGERFVTESVVYDRMAMDVHVSLLPELITICEYQEDGLSNNLNKIMKKNPAGYCLYFMQRIDLQETIKDKIIMAGKYHCFAIFSKNKKTNYTGNYNLTVLFAKPLGWIFWGYYKIMRGF